MYLILWSAILGLVAAETGQDAWLRYAPWPPGHAVTYTIPSSIVALNSAAGSPVTTAGTELQKGIQSIFGQKVAIAQAGNTSSSIVVGTTDQFVKAFGSSPVKDLAEDGFWLDTAGDAVRIVGQNERGALYGAFEYLSMLARGNVSKVTFSSAPYLPIRWANQWDNLDGSIERGYAGQSIFFQGGGIKTDLSRVSQYGRLLASVRINGIIINNVNANPSLLSDRNIDGLGRVADLLRPWGVRLGISLNFASPEQVGGLRTSDPLDSSVIDFWTKTANKIYQKVPDFAGYLIKANSEGQPGPLTYRRTLAQGANMFAKTIKAKGGGRCL